MILAPKGKPRKLYQVSFRNGGLRSPDVADELITYVGRRLTSHLSWPSIDRAVNGILLWHKSAILLHGNLWRQIEAGKMRPYRCPLARLRAKSILTVLVLVQTALLGQAPHLDRPPAKAPSSCDINLAFTANVAGSRAYLRLRYEVEALNTAQESLGALDTGIKDMDGAANPTLAIAAIITASNQAHDSLLCSAYLMGQYHPADKDDSNMRAIYISAFNREAKGVLDLEDHAKEQFLRRANQQSNAVKLRDAERISAMTAEQNGAAKDLLVATTYSLILAVDISDPNAKTTEYLSLSCDERSDLLSRSASLAHSEKSAYSTPATFIQKVLNEHKCRH